MLHKCYNTFVMEQDCLFCKIANKKISSEIVYEDNNVIAFCDINPQAPVHVLFIPKEHIATLNDLEETKILKNLYLAIKKVAKDKNIDSSGYRIVANCNSDGGQEVFHVHFHLLGGRKMNWPPG